MPIPIGLAGFAQIAQLIQENPELLAAKAAESGLLPPDLSLAEDGAPAPLPPAQDVGVVPSPPAVELAPHLRPGVPVEPTGDPARMLAFLQALQGVQAPQAPAQRPLPPAPSVPAARPIAPGGIEAIMQLLGPQQAQAPLDLARLISGR